MAYRLWLDCYSNILTYYRKERGEYYLSCKKCDPLKFKVKNQLKQDFSIKEVDSLTCTYQDEKEFLSQLRKKGNCYFKDESIDHLLLTYHNHSGKIKQVPVLYHNKLLRDYAITSRDKSKLDFTESISEFIEYIKEIAFHNTTAPYLLFPDKVRGITLEEKMLLKEPLPKDIPYQVDKVRIGLTSYLKNYRRLSLEDCELNSPLELDQELRFLNQKIYSGFLEDYQNLRSFMVWEENYQRVLKRQLQDEKDDATRMVLKSQLDQVQINRNYRNGEEDRRDEIEIISIDEAREIISFQEESKYKHIISDDMRDLLNSGGIEEVMNSMSADDIYQNMNIAKALGIIPKNYYIKK